jgi:leader peptidase (prepilin peptidase) / N-methyltransferase
MSSIIYTYLFLLGITLGSFYNVVGLRISDGMSIVKPGSRCPKCGHELKWYELIPLFSYLFLRGKCKECGVKIGIRYFLVELVTGLLFVYAYMILGFDWELLVALTLISLFVIITVSDLAYMLIEHVVILFFLVVVLIERYFIMMPLEFTTFNLHPYLETLIGGLSGFGVLFLIMYLGGKYYNKEVMGGGDVNLYGIIGLVLGFKLTFLSLFLAAIIASVLGLVLIQLKIIKRETPIPFGPFIALGSLVAYFYGSDLLNWYAGLFSM